MRGVSADRLACGAGPAPAVVPCKHGTGTLRVTVRGHVTDPLPSLAGRGLDRAGKSRPRRRFKPSGFRLRFQVLVPGSTVPERKAAELERRKVPVSQQWETTEGPIAPSGAPVPPRLAIAPFAEKERILRMQETAGAELKALVRRYSCQNVLALCPALAMSVVIGGSGTQVVT